MNYSNNTLFNQLLINAFELMTKIMICQLFYLLIALFFSQSLSESKIREKIIHKLRHILCYLFSNKSFNLIIELIVCDYD
jgi:hypothetical protein